MNPVRENTRNARSAGHDAARERRACQRTIVGVYVAVSLLWIWSSDWIVSHTASSWASDTTIQTIKGSFFVTATGVLLWVLVGRNFRRIEQLNRSLEESQVRNRRLIDQAPVAICLVRGGTVVPANHAARRLLGDTPPLLDRPLSGWVAGGSEARVSALLAGAEKSNGASRAEDVQLKNVAGDVLEVEITATPFAEGAGQVLVALVDITERKRLAELTRRSQRMEALTALTGGVVNNFNNALTAVMGHAALGRSLVPGGTGPARAFDQITEVGRHTAGMTRSLLTLCKASLPTKHHEDLPGVMRDAAELLRAMLPASVRVEADLAGLAGRTVNADAGQLQHAILQLGLNARDAMPGGGTLRISGRASGPNTAEITVSDTGRGIPPGALSQLFSGCYSTKQDPSNPASGLGLAVTRGIIEDHGGTIMAQNDPSGKGARFTIQLPLVEGTKREAAPSGDPASSSGAGRLVIVGEDNPQVRSVMVEALRLGGFAVIGAADGAEVLEAAAHNHGRLAALVLDIGMPAHSGVECLARIRAEYPSIPAVLVTGGAKPELSPEMVEHTAFLAKPFSVEDLIETVQAMVDPGMRTTERV